MKVMNRVLISLATSLLLINIAVANNYTPVLKVEGNKFYLSLDDVAAQTSIQILDREGFTWIEEKVAVSGQFKKVFNLESLPFGSYTLIIKSNVKETVQPITVTECGLIIDESKSSVYFQANLSQKRGNLNLSLLNPTNSLVRVFVINAQGRILYQDAIENQQVIDKNYNLRQFPGGAYTVVVDNAHETFSRKISLR
jgi:hypothetical protein